MIGTFVSLTLRLIFSRLSFNSLIIEDNTSSLLKFETSTSISEISE